VERELQRGNEKAIGSTDLLGFTCEGIVAQGEIGRDQRVEANRAAAEAMAGPFRDCGPGLPHSLAFPLRQNKAESVNLGLADPIHAAAVFGGAVAMVVNQQGHFPGMPPPKPRFDRPMVSPLPPVTTRLTAPRQAAATAIASRTASGL